MNRPQSLTPVQKKLVEDNLSVVSWVLHDSICVNPGIYGLAYDDLFQEGCLLLCKAALSYDSARASFPTYAKQVVRNGLISYCRSTLRHEKLFHSSLRLLSNSETCVPDDWEISLNTMETLTMLEAMKPRYQAAGRRCLDALSLRIQGQTLEQIASVYHVTPRHIATWLTRAKQQLLRNFDFLSTVHPSSPH